jgi:hypothetical protein
MISNDQSDTKSLYCGLNNILRVSLRQSTDASPSKRKDPQHPACDNPSVLLTVHHLFHILKKGVDDLEGLCGGYPSLVHSESV